MLVRRRLLLLTFLSLLCVTRLTADDGLDGARAAEQQGRYEEAVELYLAWLEANPGEPNSTDVLIHAASLADTADEAIRVLKKGTGIISETDSAEIHSRIAYLAGMIGDIEDAADHHESAGNSFEVLSLLYSMGEYESAAARSLARYRRESGSQAGADYLALYAASLMAIERQGIARDTMLSHTATYPESTSPLFLLVLYDLGLALGDHELAGSARASMKNDYPDSAALYLVENRILRWPTPGRIGLAIAPGNALDAVQVGAFIERDSAAALRSSLEEDGFTAWIERSGNYWKVLVNDPEGDTERRLREKGYESALGGT